jgi:Actin
LVLPCNAVTAVHDGFALEKSTVQSPLGGALLSRAMAASVQKKGVLIRPRLSFRRVERAPGVWEVHSGQMLQDPRPQTLPIAMSRAVPAVQDLRTASVSPIT